MKPLNIVITAFLLCSCSKHTARPVLPSTEITVVDDLTDTFTLHPIADPILALFDFPDAKNQSAKFRLVVVTDRLLNPSVDMTIADGTTTEENNEDQEIDNREQIIYNFYDMVRHGVTEFPSRYSPAGGSLKHSECFATIASELELLAKSTASQRTLIVFSDLLENNELYSCYTDDGRKLLQMHPLKIVHLLQKRCELPKSLVGITVYFVYQPKTRELDQLFNSMVAIYKQLLHERGARIVIQADNKNFQP